MKAYDVTLDGDNFIGIAVASSRDRAIEMGINNSWGGNKKNISARETSDVLNMDIERFIKTEFIDDNRAVEMGYKSVHHLSLGIK